MARLARLERATYGLEVRCSIHLSYRRLYCINPGKRSGATSGCQPRLPFWLAQAGPFVHDNEQVDP
jgi:hypothetical protein